MDDYKVIYEAWVSVNGEDSPHIFRCGECLELGIFPYTRRDIRVKRPQMCYRKCEICGALDVTYLHLRLSQNRRLSKYPKRKQRKGK